MAGEDLRITFFSCHPNPFTAAQDRSGRTAQTIRFAFLLTDVASDVSITIYTIGGSAIWNWRKSTGVIGYQEVEWNGRTSNGYRIANGTYYAKLVAAGETKKAVKRIRIAKLEGY
jgi:flagellar hook assembly protein FlgD